MRYTAAAVTQLPGAGLRPTPWRTFPNALLHATYLRHAARRLGRPALLGFRQVAGAIAAHGVTVEEVTRASHVRITATFESERTHEGFSRKPWVTMSPSHNCLQRGELYGRNGTGKLASLSFPLFLLFYSACRSPTAVLPKILHSNCRKRVPNRPLRPRRGRFGTLSQQLECGIFGRTAVLPIHSRHVRAIPWPSGLGLLRTPAASLRASLRARTPMSGYHNVSVLLVKRV